jgi:hypothetical protein
MRSDNQPCRSVAPADLTEASRSCLFGGYDSLPGTLILLGPGCWRSTIRWVGSGIAAWIKGAALLEGMVVRASSCLRHAAAGRRSDIVRYGRFLANEKVTLEALLAGWGEQTALRVAGRHVLAIQSLPS